MNEDNLKEIIAIILDLLGGEKPLWMLEGSVNLMLQGVDVSVRDLDITTNKDGLEIFRRALKNFIVRDFYNEKTKGISLIADIKGFEIEINCYGDRKSDYINKAESMSWNGFKIPILPLEHALKFYKNIDRKEKVKLIEAYLSD